MKANWSKVTVWDDDNPRHYVTLDYKKPSHDNRIMQFKESKAFQFEGKSFTRYHINMDGNCLFDTISYLYLFYKLHDTNFEEAHNLKHYNTPTNLMELGWYPKIKHIFHSQEKDNTNVNAITTAKGNLLDVLHKQDVPSLLGYFQGEYNFSLNEDEEDDTLTEKLYRDMYNQIVDFFEMFNRLGQNEKIKSAPIEMLYVLFPLIFNVDRYKLGIFVPQVNSSDVILAETPILIHEPFQNDQNKINVYIWLDNGHFEPVLRQQNNNAQLPQPIPNRTSRNIVKNFTGKARTRTQMKGRDKIFNKRPRKQKPK